MAEDCHFSAGEEGAGLGSDGEEDAMESQYIYPDKDFKMDHGQEFVSQNVSKLLASFNAQEEEDEAGGANAAMLLQCFAMSGWSLILRRDFDLIYQGEPYTLMCVLICEKSGRYLVRAWNQTIDRGNLGTIEGLRSVLRRTFHQTKPCLGKGFSSEKQGGDGLPHPRTLSKSCELICSGSKGAKFKACLPCRSEMRKKPRKRKSIVTKENIASDDASLEEPSQYDLDRLLEVDIKEEESTNDSSVLSDFEDYDDPQGGAVLSSSSTSGAFEASDDTLNCRDCNQPFQSKSARRTHEKGAHNYGLFACSECEIETIRIPDHIEHYINQHPETKQIKCPICEEDRPVDEYFNVHYTNCRKRELVKNTKVKTKDFVCTVCGFKTKYPKSLKRHVETKHNVQEKPTKQSKKKAALQYNGEKLNESFNCRECHLAHKTNAARYIHEKKVHAYGLFKCEHCGISSWKLTDHVAHIIDSHPNIKSENCAICKEEQNIHMDFVGHYKDCFRKKRNDLSKAGREKYWEKLHASNTYRFACDICEFQTNYRESIVNHKNMHERETNKPEENSKFYKYCDQCGKRFLAKRSLLEHIKTVHLKESIFAPCDQCHETFNTKLLLRRHKNMVHSTDPKFNCPECGKRFASCSDVARHLSSHTGSSRCICKECGANVAKEKMKAHERIHSGERPFPCTLCEMKFISSSTLSGHLRQKHNTSISEEKKRIELKEETM